MFSIVLKTFNVDETSGGVYICSAAIGGKAQFDTSDICVKVI